MENARFWISNECERGKVGVYGHVSMNFFFSKAIRGRKIESSRYIHDSLRSSIDVSGHHRVANTSFGKSYRLSSTVCRSARLPSARSTELSFLSRTLSSSPPDKKIARLSPVSISKRNEKNNSRFVREERECGNFAGTFEDSFEVVISHAKRKPLYTYRWNE